MVLAPVELNISTVTSILGAPIVIYMMIPKEEENKMADYYFQMKDLSVGYNGNSLIHDINIGINKGEIVTLIGPNGSGSQRF